MNLKHLRKQAGLTQEELAKFLNINQVTYGRYELETSEPNIETLIKLADYYRVSLDFLVNRQFLNEIGYLTETEKELLKNFRQMSEINQKVLLGESKVLVSKIN